MTATGKTPKPWSAAYNKELDSTQDEIRLLTLAAADNLDDKLQGELTNVPLKRAVEYTALSYCWGLPEEQEPDRKNFTIGTSTVSITPSLDLALRHMRDHKVKTLWADQVCINQDNDHEKSSQVKMMHRIYSSAPRVAVWLGSGDQQTYGDMLDLQRAKRRGEPPLSIGKPFLHNPYWSRLLCLADMSNS
jgi:hypothetical protein